MDATKHEAPSLAPQSSLGASWANCAAAAEALGRARPTELGLPLLSVRWRFGSGFGVGSVLASLPAGVGVGCWWLVGTAELCRQSSACRARPAAAVGTPRGRWASGGKGEEGNV